LNFSLTADFLVFQKIFTMACNNIFGFNPVGTPTCLRKQEVGKPSLNAAQPDAKAEGCVHDDPSRADKRQKGWSFRVGTWKIDSLTGRSGGEADGCTVFKKLGGEVVGVDSLAL